MSDIKKHDSKMPTLSAEAARAVVRRHCHPVAQPASVFGLWGGALPAALPLAVRAARRPLAPIPPAAVHWRIAHKRFESSEFSPNKQSSIFPTLYNPDVHLFANRLEPRGKHLENTG